MGSPDYSDGCMIALYPPPELAEQLAVEGGLPAEQLHVTVAYLGGTADVDGDALREIVAELASRRPFTAQLAGLARFTGGDNDVLVALLDSPDLEDLRRDTLDALYERGIQVPREHGYTAHLSISYLDPDEAAPLDRLEAQPVAFTALAAVHGADRIDTGLAHPMEAAAREAFAAGWALSGGPMTDRVRTACETAVSIATESADDPDALRATIDLGRLEGMWALLFQRRQEQQALHTAQVRSQWRELIARDDITAMVDRLRHQLGVTEAFDPARLRAEARAAAKAMLSALADLTGFTALRIALRNALAAGRAEGMVNAVAIAAERAGQVGLDWNIAFKDAYAAMERLDELWADAGGWLGKMIDGVADDLGRALADGLEAGLDRDALIDAAGELLTGDTEAIAFTVDWAMTTAADEGALSLYRSEGVLQLDIISAGDGRVCGACIDAEAGSPWHIGDQPRMPLHPNCVVGSTRVVAPDRIVPADVADGLPLDPAVSGIGGLGYPGGGAASAMTGARQDFGRRNIRAVTVRDYVGDVVVIRTALGYELAATPNHPIATRAGWVPLSELKLGDHVLSSVRSEWSAAVDPDVDNVPPCIEDVAQPLSVVLGPVPTAAEDFHGDGSGSDVHVVLADRLLGDGRMASRIEEFSELPFSGRDVRGDTTLAALGGEDEGFLAAMSPAPGPVCCFSHALTFIWGGSRHAREHGGASVSGGDAGRDESSPDCRPADAIAFREHFLALSSGIAGNDGSIVERDAGTPHGSANGNVVSLKDRDNSPSADVEGFCERVLSFASDVTADEIVHIEVRGYSGHVFNLETGEGWYAANGIVTHNCRCVYASSVSLAHFATWFL